MTAAEMVAELQRQAERERERARETANARTAAAWVARAEQSMKFAAALAAATGGKAA